MIKNYSIDKVPWWFGQRARGAAHWKRGILKFFPYHFCIQVRWEVHCALLRLFTFCQVWNYRKRRDFYVNVGAGSSGRAGWVNADSNRFKGVNCLIDCRSHIPFQDESVRGIFTEHFLEHIDYTEEAPRFLRECQRVLVKGGVLRVIVPDAAQYLRAYIADGWDEMHAIGRLTPNRQDLYLSGCYRTKIELVNEVFRQGYQHKFAYDVETLALVLREAGFSKTERMAFGRSLDPKLLIENPLRAPDSLYMDAVK